MTDDLKNELDGELPPGRVPFALDTDEAVRLGRRARKRRRLLATGGPALAVVAVAALVVGLLGPGESGPEAADPADDPTTAAADFPELDPDLSYSWAGPAYRDDPPDSVSDPSRAFWKHIDTAFPDAQLYGFLNETPVDDADRAETGFFYREKQTLLWNEDPTDPESDSDMAGFQRKTYSLLQWDYSGNGMGGAYGALTIKFDAEAEGPDDLDVTVLPPGSFKKDTGDVYDPAACLTDFGTPEQHSCDAVTATGAKGEDLRNVTLKVRDENGAVAVAAHAVVLYREDGSAVLASDLVQRSWDSGSGPQLSFEELYGIAAAIPQTPVT